MASLTYQQQQQAIKKFLAAEIKNHETASAIVMQKSAQRLRQVTIAELRRFKRGQGSQGNFHRGVKQYDFPKARGVKGPASYVRVGIPFAEAFEEGRTITPKGHFIILLPDGEKLGFKRIKPGGWQYAWNKIHDRAVIIPANDGFLIGYKINPGQPPVLIYKFHSAPVQMPKKLNFYRNAEQLADGMAEEISKLLD